MVSGNLLQSASLPPAQLLAAEAGAETQTPDAGRMLAQLTLVAEELATAHRSMAERQLADAQKSRWRSSSSSGLHFAKDVLTHNAPGAVFNFAVLAQKDAKARERIRHCSENHKEALRFVDVLQKFRCDGSYWKNKSWWMPKLKYIETDLAKGESWGALQDKYDLWASTELIQEYIQVQELFPQVVEECHKLEEELEFGRRAICNTSEELQELCNTCMIEASSFGAESAAADIAASFASERFADLDSRVERAMEILGADSELDTIIRERLGCQKAADDAADAVKKATDLRNAFHRIQERNRRIAERLHAERSRTCQLDILAAKREDIQRSLDLFSVSDGNLPPFEQLADLQSALHRLSGELTACLCPIDEGAGNGLCTTPGCIRPISHPGNCLDGQLEVLSLHSVHS